MSQALRVETLLDQPELSQRLVAVFGSPDDSIDRVVARAGALLPERQVIVWEGDPQTFIFSYVSPAAETILGYPVARWFEAGFWTGTIVHPDDASHAVSYCALATGQGRDHDFQYRARTADGATVLLHDVVHVIKGRRGVASKLRGIMIVMPKTSDG